jgi:hypothetical protein
MEMKEKDKKSGSAKLSDPPKGLSLKDKIGVAKFNKELQDKIKKVKADPASNFDLFSM